jgi:hypothetical protein
MTSPAPQGSRNSGYFTDCGDVNMVSVFTSPDRFEITHVADHRFTRNPVPARQIEDVAALPIQPRRRATLFCPSSPDCPRKPGHRIRSRGFPVCCCATATPMHSRKVAYPSRQAFRVQICGHDVRRRQDAWLSEDSGRDRRKCRLSREGRCQRSRNFARRGSWKLLFDGLSSLQQTVAGVESGSTTQSGSELGQARAEQRNSDQLNLGCVVAARWFLEPSRDLFATFFFF